MYQHLKVWLNGKMIPWSEASVPLLSHALSRGSAVFEVFGTHKNKEGVFAFRMDEHLKRLSNTTMLLGMEMAYSAEEIEKAVAKTVKANDIGRGLVKILAYYGEEAVISLVLNSKLDLAIFTIPESKELHLDSTTPISACFSKWRKLHPDTVPVSAKACANYLNGMLARMEAQNRGYDIGIFLDSDGYVAEGSIESIFMVKDGWLKTPPLGRILPSVTRKSILEAAPVMGIKTIETLIRPEELIAADEIFICHTGIKVSPVKQMEDHVVKKAPGPISRKLSQFMSRIVAGKEPRFSHWLEKLG